MSPDLSVGDTPTEAQENGAAAVGPVRKCWQQYMPPRSGQGDVPIANCLTVWLELWREMNYCDHMHMAGCMAESKYEWQRVARPKHIVGEQLLAQMPANVTHRTPSL
ncbi:hypothetical protein NDU88_005823 [Pleurodeles waltl]|uniref:Uncharacterized protein n=1 Tax=Pleurodeles waltl TaxID=8319 RepID=A0AAV7LV56_PLEWA|nr:hypothetical protein NDU88_005823 [Pleurodeles waltl]